MADWSVTGRARLGSGDRSSVDHLRRACEAADRLDLKVELDEADDLERPIHFLAETGDDVIGYAGLTSGDEFEVCGMVHPSWRRRGVGSALLAGVRDAATSLGRDSILVICEDAGPQALAWMRRIGATLESAERRMVVRLSTPAVRSPLIQCWRYAQHPTPITTRSSLCWVRSSAIARPTGGSSELKAPPWSEPFA